MGATTWNYFTPYEDDVGAALRRLREQVFRDGRYERFTFSPEDLGSFQTKPGVVDAGAPLEQQMRRQEGEALLHWVARMQKLVSDLLEEVRIEAGQHRKIPAADPLRRLEGQGQFVGQRRARRYQQKQSRKRNRR
jgi:hypothetical protein